MDGNGRWAQNNSLPRIEGHWAGVKVVDRIVTLSRKLKLEALTLYSFSDENWNRPSAEIRSIENPGFLFEEGSEANER